MNYLFGLLRYVFIALIWGYLLLLLLAIRRDVARGRRREEPVQGRERRAWLRVVAGAEEGTRHALSAPEECVLGRDPACQLVLSSENVSRQHARVSCSSVTGRYSVVDLDSRNGTFVNGRRIAAKTTLEDGDVITLGDAAKYPDAPRLEFRYEPEA